jgi:hypothetical protein
MPVVGTRRPKTNWEDLLETLRSQAQLKDGRAICSTVQAELDMAGNPKYEAAPEGREVSINLPGGECLVFLIMGRFRLDDTSDPIKERGLGHTVKGSSVLTLDKATAVVIISGY